MCKIIITLNGNMPCSMLNQVQLPFGNPQWLLCTCQLHYRQQLYYNNKLDWKDSTQ